jgi:hypothetical protein
MVVGVALSLLELARTTAQELGLPPPDGVHAPGASDANFAAALGVSTLEAGRGLGLPRRILGGESPIEGGGPLTTARQAPTIPVPFDRLAPAETIRAAQAFADRTAHRRSVREFSADPIPEGVVEAAIRAAATAPSGANIQPWRFVAVTDPARKRRLREAAEAEEREFYAHRATAEWLDAIAPIGTDWRKPFLEVAPVVIVVFEVHQGPAQPQAVLRQGVGRPGGRPAPRSTTPALRR